LDLSAIFQSAIAKLTSKKPAKKSTSVHAALVHNRKASHKIFSQLMIQVSQFLSIFLISMFLCIF